MVSMVAGLKGRNYEGKLVELGLQTLETRRKRYKLSRFWKVLIRLRADKADKTVILSSKPCEKARYRTDIRNNFFSSRGVEPWNRLDTDLNCEIFQGWSGPRNI